MKFSNRLRLLFLNVTLLLSALFMRCAEVAYNINLYQDGRTLGKGELEIYGTAGFQQHFGRTVSTKTDCRGWTDCETTRSYETWHGQVPVLSILGQIGMTSNLDFGIDG